MRKIVINFLVAVIFMTSCSLVGMKNPLNVLIICASGQTHNTPTTNELIKQLNPLNKMNLSVIKNIYTYLHDGKGFVLNNSIDIIILLFTPSTRVIDNKEELVKSLSDLGIGGLMIPKLVVFLVGPSSDIEKFSGDFPKQTSSLGFENKPDKNKFLIIPWFNEKPRPTGQKSFDSLKNLLDDAATEKAKKAATEVVPPADSQPAAIEPPAPGPAPEVIPPSKPQTHIVAQPIAETHLTHNPEDEALRLKMTSLKDSLMQLKNKLEMLNSKLKDLGSVLKISSAP